MKKQPIISLLCCFLLFVAGCSTPHQGNTYDIIAFGAKGDGKTDDAAAIQRAINACSAAGGGTVIIPAGHTFLCGPLQLASYVNLHLEPNSRLLANPDESIYTWAVDGCYSRPRRTSIGRRPAWCRAPPPRRDTAGCPHAWPRS